jgi:preprotein translocase SecE subunit
VALDKQGKKWINAGVAITCIVVFYVLLSFFSQIGEWFELEAKIASFTQIAQGLSALIAIVAFFVVTKHPELSSYLAEAYSEIIKVVYPDKNETMSMTFKVMILVTIIGFVLGFFDWAAGYLLSLLPQM